MRTPDIKRLARLTVGIFLTAVPVLLFILMKMLPEPVQIVEAAPMQQVTFSVSFTNPAYSQEEDAGQAAITVQVSPAITDTAVVTVEYLTAPGTAEAGADYTTATGILTFTQTAAIQSFNIPLIDNNTNDGNRTVNLILRNPSANAELGLRSTATLTILDDDPVPTATATATTGAPPVFVDAYEPNNSIAQAYEIGVDAAKLCDNTLWPRGDEDYFRFSGKAGSTYIVSTSDLDPGIDTEIFVYNPTAQEIARNDDQVDAEPGDLSSRVRITADVSGFYYVRVINRDPSDPANKTYCVLVEEVEPFTPTPSATPITGDPCEFNSTIDTACTIGLGETPELNFVPVYGSEQDTDVFRLWIKPGILYTCETFDLSPVADTNMIFLNNEGNDFQPNLGNDDKAIGDFGSQLSYYSTYTGWLYIVVGPVNVPPYEDSDEHTYKLQCTSTVSTATPTASATSQIVPTSPGASLPPTATPMPLPTLLPSPTPIDLSILTPQATPTLPVVQFQPLPTSTPSAGSATTANVEVTVYYDTNFNYLPEINEGIQDVAVALYDNSTGALLAFGYTNEAGTIRFTGITATGAVRVVVPFLGYSQVVVGGDETILLRVAPQPLPIGIP